MNKQIALNQQLGKLFYAVAAADKTIREEERYALKTQVRNDWIQEIAEKNPEAWDAYSQIEVEFELLIVQEADSQDCFAEFKEFYLENKSLYTLDLEERIWKTVQAVAQSVAGYNKSELVILSQIKNLLEKI